MLLFSSLWFAAGFGVLGFQVRQETVKIIFSGLLSLLEKQCFHSLDEKQVDHPFHKHVCTLDTCSIITRLLSCSHSPNSFWISSASSCSLSAWNIRSHHKTAISQTRKILTNTALKLTRCLPFSFEPFSSVHSPD